MLRLSQQNDLENKNNISKLSDLKTNQIDKSLSDLIFKELTRLKKYETSNNIGYWIGRTLGINGGSQVSLDKVSEIINSWDGLDLNQIEEAINSEKLLVEKQNTEMLNSKKKLEEIKKDSSKITEYYRSQSRKWLINYLIAGGSIALIGVFLGRIDLSKIIKEDPEYTLRSIEINPRICEFKDGFYIIEYDT